MRSTPALRTRMINESAGGPERERVSVGRSVGPQNRKIGLRELEVGALSIYRSSVAQLSRDLSERK